LAGIDAGIKPQELRAHTGVIGEATAADYLGVKLSAENNQRGHDLLDPDGLRVSVKTITTSTGVALNERTIDLVDRVIVVWMDTSDDNLDTHIVYDKSTIQFYEDCAAPYRRSLRLQRSAMTFPNKPASASRFDVGHVVDTYIHKNVEVRRHSSGSFTTLVDGKIQPARQYLLAIRDDLGLSDKTNNTTRSLGAQIFRKVNG
jgi:hypothetical protein